MYVSIITIINSVNKILLTMTRQTLSTFHHLDRKVTILGKHTKRISTGAWSKENLLALAGDDRCVTISNLEGDTIAQVPVNGDIKDVQFSEMKRDERSPGENTVRPRRTEGF